MGKPLTEFRVTDVTSHRNGVGGRPFHSVRFSYTAGDFTPPKFYPNMLAVVPNMPVTDFDKGLTECFVMDLNNPGERFRGECFMHYVLKAIADHKVIRDAYWDALSEADKIPSNDP